MRRDMTDICKMNGGNQWTINEEATKKSPGPILIERLQKRRYMMIESRISSWMGFCGQTRQDTADDS